MTVEGDHSFVAGEARMIVVGEARTTVAGVAHTVVVVGVHIAVEGVRSVVVGLPECNHSHHFLTLSLRAMNLYATNHVTSHL